MGHRNKEENEELKKENDMLKKENYRLTEMVGEGGGCGLTDGEARLGLRVWAD